MINPLDSVFEYVAPRYALKRMQARRAMAYYEAAKKNNSQKQRREAGSGNDAVSRAGVSLRQQARHFEQNYDLALGVLNTLVCNVVGPNGIMPEPQPRMKDGRIHEELARQIMNLHADWALKPEVTWTYDWAATQRIMARVFFRDGEAFAQTLEGLVPFLDHGTRVPLSLEMFEADYVPLEYDSPGSPRICQGIEINAWNRPVAFHVYKTNPTESITGALSTSAQTKRIGAANMLHIANRHRIGQLRGVSIFASVLGRFDDLKDYEESERIAAKVAASMAAFIKKGSPDQYVPANDPDDPNSTPEMRSMKFNPGMVFDDLRLGEDIGTIDTNRPNPNLESYRSGQLKAIASGTGPTYSSISKTYDGTYSAQRQELVEGWVAYATLSNEFISRIIRPVYQKFISLAVASGQLKLPKDLDLQTLDDALFIAPQMPWIDPLAEAEGAKAMVRSGFMSEVEVIRRRGASPSEVMNNIISFRKFASDNDLILDSDAAKTSNSGASQDYLREREKIDYTTDGIKNALSKLNEIKAEFNAAMSAKPAQPPSIIVNNHLPEPSVTFEAHMPEQAAPVVNVETAAPIIKVESAAPVVNVTTPEPVVNIEAVMPDQAAPVVNVTNEVQPATVSVNLPPRKTETTVERDAMGNLTKATQVETSIMH